MTKRLILISPGPRMSIETKGYKRLSEYFSGDIITSSEIDEVLRTKKIAGFGFNCVKFKYKHRLLSNLRFIGYCISFALKSRLKRKKYDLVVTYDPLKTGLMGVIVARIVGAKFTPEVNGVYTSPNEWVDDPESISIIIKKNVYPVIMRVVLKHADGIKLLFDNQIEPFKNILSGKIVRRYPNFVDINAFIDVNEDEEKEVLFVGFPYKRKGADLVIDAFKKIADKHPEWRLRILGWFPDIAPLMAAIDGHKQIIYSEPVQHSQMPLQLGRCSLFVLPSRSEAMGRVLVEAMAAGKPRIGANVDGIPTVINDGIDGLLVEPENVNDLSEKMDLLIRSPDLRKKLGENGRKRARQEFSGDVYFNNQIEFYKQILSND